MEKNQFELFQNLEVLFSRTAFYVKNYKTSAWIGSDKTKQNSADVDTTLKQDLYHQSMNHYVVYVYTSL